MSLWLPCGLHGAAVPNTVTVTVVRRLGQKGAESGTAWHKTCSKSMACRSFRPQSDVAVTGSLCCPRHKTIDRVQLLPTVGLGGGGSNVGSPAEPTATWSMTPSPLMSACSWLGAR